MHDKYNKMAKIDAIVAGMLNRDMSMAFAIPPSSLDISKPNEHDSKKEFTVELNAVETGLKHTTGMIDLFVLRDDQGTVVMQNRRMSSAIDKAALRDVNDLVVESAFDVIHLNMGKTGYSTSLLMTLLNSGLRSYGIKKKSFGQLGTAPNYYARTIALRLARIYCLETGVKPTFGTASDGGHPSTVFAKAIEQVFDILGIECDIRGPIEWALSQLTESDFTPRRNAMMGYFSKPDPTGTRSDSAVVNAIMGIGKPPKKGSLE